VITEKGGMVAWEIKVRRDLAGPVLINVGIVPITKNHVDAGTAPILQSHINVEPVHVHTDMPNKVRIPRRSGSLTTLLWML